MYLCVFFNQAAPQILNKSYSTNVHLQAQQVIKRDNTQILTSQSSMYFSNQKLPASGLLAGTISSFCPLRNRTGYMSTPTYDPFGCLAQKQHTKVCFCAKWVISKTGHIQFYTALITISQNILKGVLLLLPKIGMFCALSQNNQQIFENLSMHLIENCSRNSKMALKFMHASKGILNLPTSSLHFCSPFQQTC